MSYCRLDIHAHSQVFSGGQGVGGYQAAGSVTIPPILMQQGSGSWQAPLTSFPTSMVVPIGNFHPSAELNELSELRKRLDEEMRLRKDLCIQNSREVTGLRGDNKVIKQKTKILEQDLSAERKKRKEREATLDKVREEKWYAVNEVKEKLGELEKEQQRRKLAETTLENIKVELVKERERRKSVEKVLKELEGGKATEVALYYKKLEKDERLRKAREKREEYLRKEKLKEKEREKRDKELEGGKAIEVALDYEKPEKEFGEEWEDDHFQWEGRGVGMMMPKRRRNESCGSREQEPSQKSKQIIRGKGEETRWKAAEVNDEGKESDAVGENSEQLAKKDEMKVASSGGRTCRGVLGTNSEGEGGKVEVRHRQIQCPRCTRKVCMM